MHIRLWHSPYNGGWIYFDKKQRKRFRCGYGIKDYDYITGKNHIEPTLWWCFWGFCGRITFQSWPWQKYPGGTPNTEIEGRAE